MLFVLLSCIVIHIFLSKFIVMHRLSCFQYFKVGLNKICIIPNDFAVYWYAESTSALNTALFLKYRYHVTFIQTSGMVQRFVTV
jgi:hypothetical protein